MTREEMWKEFENQLIRETRTPITVSYDVSEKMRKSAIETTVAKWKERLERELSNSEKPNKSEIPTGSTVVDCISRKSVIAIIQNHWWNCRDIDKLVNELPSVTPQEPRWIPVTERLPEEGQFVIVSYPYDASDYSRKRVMTAWYHKEYGFTCGIADAWMPLPEPYRTGREE